MKLLPFQLFSAITVGVSLGFGAATASSDTIRVDDSATGAGNGTSWCDAYVHLQDALAAAAASGGAINEIRVAQGTYIPDQGVGEFNNNRLSTFRLLNGVTIFGGYAGCGALNADENDGELYETILSGDLLGNDVGDRFSPTRLDNAYHVVTSSGTNLTAVLVGVTVTAGRADGAAPHHSGGGLYVDGGTPTILHCTFVENWAQSNGGAMYNKNNSDLIVTNCSFLENSADYGGAINNESGSDGTFSFCTFTGNTADIDGGAVHNSISSFPVFHGCTFLENEAFFDGGAAMQPNSVNPARPAFTDCLFEKNRALTGGGGAFQNEGGSATMTNCVFRENQADLSGGAISSSGGGTAVIHSTFVGNRARNGGAVVNQGLSSLENCLLHDNRATADGGAIYHFGGAGLFVTKCTIVRNEAGDQGGGVYNTGTALYLFDDIVFGNEDAGGFDESAQIHGTGPTIGNSCVQGWIGGLGGSGNHGDDPLFAPGPASCFYLSQTAAGQSVDSPCVDDGSKTVAGSSVEGRTTRSDEFSDQGLLDQGFHFAVSGEPCVMGRYQCHGRVDLRDFAAMQNCFDESGPCCEIFELTAPPGVDLDDFALFSEAISGPY